MNKLLSLLAFLVLLAVASCKPSVPSAFLDEDELEDLLYDYHLADAMAQNAKGDYATNLVEYRTAVLKKHGVSQQEFDTTMVYYMRHTDQLHAVYQRLAERFDNEAKKLGATGGVGTVVISASGDTTDIWNGPKAMALLPNQPYNLQQFAVKADSSFHKGDSFTLLFDTNFLFQDGTRNGMAYLAMVFENDSVTTRSMHLSSANHFQLKLEDRDTLGIKEIKGFFLLGMINQNSGSATALHLMTVTDVHLLKCHLPKKESKDDKQQPDSAQTKLSIGSPLPSKPREQKPREQDTQEADSSSKAKP